MKLSDDMQAAAEPVVIRTVPAVQRSRNQIRASATADGIAAKAKWRTLMAEAQATWESVPMEDLAKVDGNFHKLAGLVQLRHRLSREESDRQVRDFFGKHYPIA